MEPICELVDEAILVVDRLIATYQCVFPDYVLDALLITSTSMIYDQSNGLHFSEYLIGLAGESCGLISDILTDFIYIVNPLRGYQAIYSV